MVSRVGQGMGVLDRVATVEGEEAVLGVNFGRPIVNNRDLLRSSAVVRKPIELSFGVVSGVGPRIDE